MSSQPGDKLVRPMNAPDAGQVWPGVQPGTTGPVVLARLVIVSGAGGEILIYNGTPGPGTLIGSWAGAAGVDTPQFLNTVLKDLTVYSGSSSGYVNITSSGAAGGNDGILFNPAGATHVLELPQISGRAINNGLASEVEILQFSSGLVSGLDSADLSLQSEAADGSVGGQIQQAIGGTLLTQLFKTIWDIGVPISCTLGTPANPSVITNGAFTRIASPFSNGWVSGGGINDSNGIIYRMNNDGNFEIWFDIINPGAQVNSVVHTFSSPFIPQKNLKHQIAGSLAGAVWATLDSSGNFIMTGNTAANAEIAGRCMFYLGTIPP